MGKWYWNLNSLHTYFKTIIAQRTQSRFFTYTKSPQGWLAVGIQYFPWSHIPVIARGLLPAQPGVYRNTSWHLSQWQNSEHSRVQLINTLCVCEIHIESQAEWDFEDKGKREVRMTVTREEGSCNKTVGNAEGFKEGGKNWPEFPVNKILSSNCPEVLSSFP